MNRDLGFTLIELLVTISIIGMLSSVVIASTQSVRDRGRIAAGIIFATHVYRGYGDTALGFWSLNNTGNDAGGNNNPGTLIGINGNSPPSYAQDHYSGSTGKKSLSLNNPNNADPNQTYQYANMGSNASFATKEVTMVAWIKLSADQVAYDDYQTIVSYFPYYGMVLCDGKLAAYGGGRRPIDQKWNPQQPSCPNIKSPQSLGDDKWHQVAMTTKIGQTNKTVLYVDGKIVSTGTLTDYITTNTNAYDGAVDMSVGAKRSENSSVDHPFNGKIAEVGVYPIGLIATDIQRMYAEVAPQYKLALAE